MLCLHHTEWSNIFKNIIYFIEIQLRICVDVICQNWRHHKFRPSGFAQKLSLLSFDGFS
jgi:hypothetical protein